MKNKLNILFLVFIFVLSLNFTFACYTPTGGDVGKIFNGNSGSNLTICTGDYSYDSTSTHIFELQGSNYVFDCNNSNFYGNISGYDRGTMFRITGNNVTIKNCNIHSFDTGIEVLNTNNNIIIDDIFYSIKNYDISLNQGSYNILNNITSFGDYFNDNFHESIDLSHADNNNISNLNLYNQRTGLYIFNSNNNNFDNIFINASSTGFQLQSGSNNYFNKFTICNYPGSGIFGNNVILQGNEYGNVLNNSNIYGNNSRGIQISGENKLIINTNISGSENYAIFFAGSNVNNTLYNLNISNNPGKGIYFAGSDSVNNTIYNNYFSNNSQNIDLRDISNTPNYFNITKTLGTNIIGGANIGGNFYDDYTGFDSDFDGIGDTNYSLGYGIYDYLPLTNNQSVATSSCLTPTNSGDIYISESTTLCTGNYILDDDYDYMMHTGNEGVFIINSSNIIFDCNSSTINGNSTYFGIVSDFTFSNITILNCNFENYYGGIKSDSDITIIKNSNFTNIQDAGDGNVFGEAIQVSGANNLIDNVQVINSNRGLDFGSSGVVNNSFFNNITQTALRISQNTNTTIQNTRLFFSETGLYFYNGVNVKINNISSFFNEYGIQLQGSDNMSIFNSNISNNQKGLFLLEGYHEDNNNFYNNYFSNNSQYHINATNELNNYFNTTKTLGTNIIGGNHTGGNFYDDYTGQDSNADGIGDTSYQIITTTGILYDYLPLTNNQSIASSNRNVNVSILNGPNFNEGDTVQFSINYENFTNPVNISINFDDGNVSNFSSISSPFYINHTFLDNDFFNVSVRVNDNVESILNNKLTNVSNSIPFNLDSVYMSGSSSKFQFQAKFLDNGTEDTHNISINWGDSNSSLIENFISNNVIKHNYSSDGNYTINFTISDDDGGMSDVYSFNVSLIDDEFKILNNQTINLTDNATLELFIKNIISTSDLNISWGDGLNTYNASAQTNGTIYEHNYSSFGNFTINTTLTGCKSGSMCVGGNIYIATMWVNVIGYGDGLINGNESCDTNNFGSLTCSNYGFNAGSLTCNSGVIDSSACHTQSSSSGGGGSHHHKKAPILKVLNESLINKTVELENQTKLNLTENIINNSKFKKLNLSKLNNTFKIEKNNTLIQNISNQSDVPINITIPLIENETELFDFIPYVNTIFDFFKIDFKEEKYNFKPRLSLIFTQLGNDINWSKREDIIVSNYNFKPGVSLIFTQLKNEINWTKQKDIIVSNYDFKPRISFIFNQLGTEINNSCEECTN